MSLTSENELSSFVIESLLRYLNKIMSPSDVDSVDSQIAQNILEKRELVGGTFTSIEEIADVENIDSAVILTLIKNATSSRKNTAPKELFRFMRLTKPKPFEHEANRDSDFVRHPYEGDSDLLTEIADEHDPKERFDIVENFIGGNDQWSLKQLRTRFPDLCKFAIWLKDNKKSLSHSILSTHLDAGIILGESDLLELWENLFYQTYTNDAPIRRQLVIQLLQANNLLVKYNTAVANSEGGTLSGPLDPVFFRLAKASVVIPSILVSKKGITKTTQQKADLNARDQKLLEDKLDREWLNQGIRNLKAFDHELRLAEEKYQKLYLKSYKSEYFIYNSQLEALYETHKVVNGETGKVTYPGMVIPDFVFSKINVFEFIDDEIDDTQYKNFLYLVGKYKLPSEGLSFDEVRKSSNEEMGWLYSQLVQNPEPTNKIIFKKGHKIPLSSVPATESISYAVRKVYSSGVKYGVYVTQYFKDHNYQINEVTVSVSLTQDPLSETQNQMYNESSIRPISKTDQYVTYLLFPHGIPFDPDAIVDINISYRNKNSNGSVTLSPATIPLEQPVTTAIPPYEDGLDGIPGGPGGNTVYGITQIGVGEFNRVEQEICCYVEGEVSHIENILAREYKERATRNTMRSEFTTESTTEREVEEINDTTTTDRNELQKEISRVMEEQQSKQFGASTSVSGGYPGVNFSASANLGFSNSSSTSNSYNEAESYAQEVSEYASKRILERVTEKRTSRIMREYEETNKHGFDNREGTEHVTGIYRWVDKIYNNRLVNYGKRLMYEFMIPEPSKNYKHFMMPTGDEPIDPTINLSPPPHPNSFQIFTPNDIGWGNAVKIAGVYNAEIELLPQTEITLSKAIAENTQLTGSPDPDLGEGAYTYTLEIPEGYKCIHVSYRAHIQKEGGANNPQLLRFFPGDQNLQTNASGGGGAYDLPLRPVEKELGIAISTHEVTVFNLSLVVKCVITVQANRRWREGVYLTIMNAYHAQLAAYEEAMAAATASVAPVGEDENTFTDYNNNPILNRAIEKRELKRIAIEMMMKIFYSATIGRSHYFHYAWKNNYKVLVQSPEFNWHTAHIKFLEDAVDWEIMAYTFYPYFWAEEESWRKLLHNTSSSDLIFESFLQSGMAKVLVPIRPGYEKAFLYYLDTGLIWEEGDVISDSGDEAYMSILAGLEVKDPDETGNADDEPKVWQTKVPTALTIVQANSAALDLNGLPCCENGVPLALGYSQLGVRPS